MKEMKRILSLVLCLVMLVGYLPVNARAEGETTTEPSVVLETVAETVTETTEETEPAKPDKPADPKTAEEPKGPGKDEKPAKPEKPGKPEHEKPGKPGEETVPVTEATVPETTEVTVPVTEETVPETTAATVPETTEATVPETAEATVPETTEETVPETTEETLPAMMMMAAPKAALPEDFVDAAIFFSDLHTSQSDYKESTVKGIMNALQNSGLNFSSVTSCGDAFSVNSGSGYTGYTGTITGYIRSVFADIPVNYVWSDHDRCAVQEDGTTLLDNDSGFVYGAGADGVYGTTDDGNYYIYELSMADLSTNNRYNADFHSDAEVTATIAEFVADADKLDQTKPLFIASHQPLLDRRNDNGHALEWATAINTVAADMDVAFFFGHNHKYDVAGDYYYAKGSTMPVCKDKDGNAENVELNFTHLCTGYLAPSSTGSTSNTTRQGTAMAVAIFEDSIQYVTYNASGEYTGSYALNETVTRDHAEAETEEPEDTQPTDPPQPEVSEPVADQNGTGITVAAPGVTEVTVTVNENPTYDAEAYSAYASYDIQVTGYENGVTATVTVPAPEGFNADLPVVVLYEGEVIATTNIVEGKITFTTNHFSIYDVAQVTDGDEGEADTNREPETATGSGTIGGKKTVYKLTSSISAGNEYLIVNGKQEGSYNALANNNGSVAATGVTVKTDSEIGTYIELDDAADELWTVASDDTFKNGSYYLGYTTSGNNWWDLTYTFGLSETARNWSYNNNLLSTSVGDWNSTTYYLCYNSGWDWTNSRNASGRDVYFYVPTEIDDTTTVSGTYSIVGNPAEVTKVVTNGTTATLGSKLIFTPSDGGAVTTTENPDDVTYTVVEGSDIISVTGNTVTFTGKYGKALVKVSCPVTFGEETKTVTNYITVEATEPYYTIELCEPKKDAEGNITSYEPITQPIAKKGVVSGQTMNVWAVVKRHDDQNPDGVDLGTVTNDLYWTVSDESIATINAETGVITFTGTNFGTFQVSVYYQNNEGKPLCTDTVTISAAESQYVVPGDGTDDFPEYPNEGAVRFDKTATAVGNFSETGIAKVELSMTGVPYTTKNRMDVVLMLDRSSSMYKSGVQHRISSTVEATKAFIKSIVINEDGSFNNNRILVLDFLGGNLDSSQGGGSNHQFQSNRYTTQEESGYQIINNQAELDALLTKIENDFKGQTSLYGTEYAKGLEACYDALAASKADGNKQFCVFMSDGIPNYMQGETTHFKKTSDIVARFTGSSGSNTPNMSRGSNYEYEYYSTQMKTAGVTVYTVGLGLANKNSAWSGATAAACEQVANMLLNDIAGPAGETATQRDTGNAVSKLGTYFFSVADNNAAADMENVFGTIAQKILEAATDVVVEDKIDNDFTVNFGLPTGVTSQATDGITDFYIQAVEYQLNADKERTGTPSVLENFTFDANGALKSHSVDGVVTCQGTDCTHVTYLTGKVIKIDGTYFDYERKPALDANGSQMLNEQGDVITEETLTWNAEKLTTTELALQYFAYLDNSAGYDPESQVDPGTYYTNEYATLTYTNYKGNRVQREFPIPQVTWNGAQVSYVFYLVNEAGQPVNRAGKVVPFNEAVYVTDVHTYSVVWNDMEQSAGLNANYLAKDLVPEVYALYDEDAGYDLHVYEDEEKVNLNNHFIIRGDVTDDENTQKKWTNSKTTYVFNTKADAYKYNEVKAYIANDGDDTNDSKTYLCKDYNVSDAVYEKVTEGTTSYNKVTSATYSGSETQWRPGDGDSYTGGALIDGCVYYVDEESKVYTIVVKNDGTEAHKGFDFSNTTVAFAVVWKPSLAPDTVVVDYGLDVVIDVTTNDAMASGVVGVRAEAPSGITMNSGNYTAAEAQTVDVYIDSNNDNDRLKENKIGTATVENLNQVRFSMDKTNGMQFTDPAVFYYESGVNYYNDHQQLVTTNMYSSVTVIPATTVYYEDEYVTLKTFTSTDSGATYTEKSGWDVNSVHTGAIQDQDRPGASKISAALDADNNYGYDKAYSTMSQYSMGNAAMTNVSSAKYATAEFTFYGTGFDIISLTSASTGIINIHVYKASDYDPKNPDPSNAFLRETVDTYYGYKRVIADDGTVTWETTASDDSNALYQIPVMKIGDGKTTEPLPYGKYTAVITATYIPFMDHNKTDSGYNFYLDAIRIYNPTGNQDDVANNAYKADGENYPVYFEVRDQMITKNTFDTLGDDAVGGIVFIDGAIAEPSIAEYTSYGPNNEVYLDNGQAIAFALNATANAGAVSEIQLAIKSVGGAGKIEVYGVNADGTRVSCLDETINTATDMYYDITVLNGKNVVIKNVGGTSDAIISITNVKVTYTEAQQVAAPSMFAVSRRSIGAVLATMNVQEPEIPGTSEPEVIEPETTIPEETVEPETTEPEETEPEETKPDKEAEKHQKEIQKALEKAAKEAAKIAKELQKNAEKAAKEAAKALSKLFSGWF